MADNKLIAHPKYLWLLKLTDQSALEPTITRLSYLSKPQLEKFFDALKGVTARISWRNGESRREELERFQAVMQKVESGDPDREDLLYALAQLVGEASNWDHIVKAFRQNYVKAFMEFAQKGDMTSDEVMELIERSGDSSGPWALRRIELNDKEVRAILPQIFREALGIKTPAPKTREEVQPENPLRPEKNAPSTPGLMNTPTEVAKMWGVTRFIFKNNTRNNILAADVKALDSQTRHILLPEPKTAKGPKPMDSGKIFLTVAQILLESRIREKNKSVRPNPDFPYCLQTLITLTETESTFMSNLVRNICRHIAGGTTGFDHEGIARFGRLLLECLNECADGQVYSSESLLEGIRESVRKNQLKMPALLSPYAYNYNAYQDRAFSYYKSADLTALDLELPIIKMYLGVLALFGLAKIYIGAEPEGRNRRSQFDSITNFEITPLGRYAMKLTEELPEFEEYTINEARLDPEYPFIYVPENLAEVYAPYLKKFARPIGSSRYAVSVESFMNGIGSRQELNERINQFREFVGGELPDNWTALIDKITSRANSVAMKPNYYTALKLNPEDADLMEFVMTDSVISEYCFRGENHTLFVPTGIFNTIHDLFTKNGFLF